MSATAIPYDGFAEYWARGDWSKYVTELHPSKSDQQTLAILEQPAGDFPDPGFEEFHLQLILNGNFNADVAFGDQRFSNALMPGSIVLAPPNTDTDYRLSKHHRFASLAINKKALERFCAQSDTEAPSDFGVLHSQSFFDPVIETLMIQMLEYASGEHPVSDLFVDTATNAVLASLFCKSLHITENQKSFPLEHNDLQRVAALVEDRLEEGITIADLASVTSLSDWHFARSFKAAMGSSPHQYVLKRRIVRAKELLSYSDLPLAEVAAASGFSSQSHMSDVFRQKVGTTPGKYRKNTTA
ncbi:MAG: AraC family transcriptional regulator [Pseudomonadota bacterium]